MCALDACVRLLSGAPPNTAERSGECVPWEILDAEAPSGRHAERRERGARTECTNMITLSRGTGQCLGSA
jgi:hypothetical protein